MALIECGKIEDKIFQAQHLERCYTPLHRIYERNIFLDIGYFTTEPDYFYFKVFGNFNNSPVTVLGDGVNYYSKIKIIKNTKDLKDVYIEIPVLQSKIKINTPLLKIYTMTNQPNDYFAVVWSIERNTLIDFLKSINNVGEVKLGFFNYNYTNSEKLVLDIEKLIFSLNINIEQLIKDIEDFKINGKIPKLERLETLNMDNCDPYVIRD